VDSREQFKALQAHVAAARAAFEAGDRNLALEHLDHVQAIDPSFLAAQSLRERVLAAPLVGSTSGRPTQPESTPLNTPERTPIRSPAPQWTPLRSPAHAHERIELRAKQRRVDHCIAATRAALGRRQLEAASASLNELIGLEPGESNVTSLSAELADLRRRLSRRPFGVRLVAASAFLAVAGTASWLERPRHAVPVLETTTALKSVATAQAATAPVAATDSITAIEEPRTSPTPPPPALERIERVTSSDNRAAQVIAPAVAPTRPAVLTERPSPPPVTAPLSLPTPLSQLPSPAVASTPEPSPASAVATVSAVSTVSTDAAVVTPAAVRTPPGDQELVEEALQRYRRAYGRLNVQSALAVYPTVNRGALARAFDGLESQALTFDSCDVELRGVAARAICHGSARYVPKVGSREMHTEPLVWSFELRKSDGDWTIESAKASR
jgi:hypothetical protein